MEVVAGVAGVVLPVQGDTFAVGGWAGRGGSAGGVVGGGCGC